MEGETMMVNEGATNERLFSTRIPIETVWKATREFSEAGDLNHNESIRRAVEESTRDILRPQDYRAIAREADAKLEARFPIRMKIQIGVSAILAKKIDKISMVRRCPRTQTLVFLVERVCARRRNHRSSRA